MELGPSNANWGRGPGNTNTRFATLNFNRFSTKVCFRFCRGCFFFARKTTSYLRMLDINDTTKDKNITVSTLVNRILKIWDTLFEMMQIETQYNKNYFTFFCNVKLELWKGTLTWNKKSHAQNQQKIFKKYF